MYSKFKYFCENCDYGTNIKCNMQNHYKSMRHFHVKTTYDYHCQYCDYTTHYASNMAKHLKTKKHLKLCPHDEMITKNYKISKVVSVPLCRRETI